MTWYFADSTMRVVSFPPKRSLELCRNAEVLKDACNYVAFELKDVAVLNYLGANTRASNIDRVNRALEPEGQGPSRARVVIGESQKIAMATGSIYANLDTVRHVGRLTRDKKAGECDHFACAILEGDAEQ